MKLHYGALKKNKAKFYFFNTRRFFRILRKGTVFCPSTLPTRARPPARYSTFYNLEPRTCLVTAVSSGTKKKFLSQFIYLPNTIYERIQYKLEEESYDTIPDLVNAYVGSKKPVTVMSGARISVPVNRTAPLSFYVSKYATQAEHTRLHGTLSRPPSKGAHPR